MASCRFAFSALLKKINPSPGRSAVAQRLPGEVRDWLKEHDYETSSPHSRLIGSYGRHTATGEIKDVDALLFLPGETLDRTPESVLRELKGVLDAYPDASAEASPQRRSIRLDFPDHGLCMDIVGAVADGGLEEPLQVPDREKKNWITSDPLGYGRSLSAANAVHGEKLVPLIKLVKAWRDEQMTYRRPKSYLLEVIVYHAVVGGGLTLKGGSTAENVCTLFEHVAAKWEKAMDEGDRVPPVLDPQLGTVISRGWTRSEFETFMRRVRETSSAARSAVDADTDSDAHEFWKKVFGDLWPSEDEAKEEAMAAAAVATPGEAFVAPTGAVAVESSSGALRSRPTTFHGATE